MSYAFQLSSDEFSPQTTSESVQDAFKRHQSAVAVQGQASAGITDFPNFRRYQRSTRAVEYAIQELRQLSLFRPGWDGYDAEAPRHEAIRDASEFLQKLRSDAKFAVSAEADGAVHLTVEGNDLRSIFIFEGDGQVSILTRSNGTWNDQGPYVLGARNPVETEDSVKATL